jgi:hypothetical protein
VQALPYRNCIWIIGISKKIHHLNLSFLEQLFVEHMQMQLFSACLIDGEGEMHPDLAGELYCYVSSPLNKVAFFLMF